MAIYQSASPNSNSTTIAISTHSCVRSANTPKALLLNLGRVARLLAPAPDGRRRRTGSRIFGQTERQLEGMAKAKPLGIRPVPPGEPADRWERIGRL